MKNDLYTDEITNELAISEAPDYPETDELVSLIDSGDFRAFRTAIESVPAVDVAGIMSELPERIMAKFFRLLPKEVAAVAFVEIDREAQEHLIGSLTDSELSSFLDELYLDDTVDIIEEMPANVVKRILRASSPEDRVAINTLLRYPKDSAGSIMTTEYVRFTPEMTVDAALSHIRRVAIDKETIYTCYVTDKKRRLVGIVTAKELLISSLDTPLSEIMREHVISVGTGDDKETVAHKLDKYGFLALPVVDAEERLVGIVTLDDALTVIKDAAEEDFAKMAAVTPSEEPYVKASAFSLFRARIPWLLLLMISATLSSMILNRFEAILPAVLVLFVPMLMDTGGNSGSQTSVTVIRAISLDELPLSRLPLVLWKELRVGLSSGLVLAAVAFGKVLLVDRLIMQNPAVSLSVAFAVSISLAATVVMAKLIGAALPMLAKRIGFDPAVMASPLITTLVDAISLVLYFFIASSILNI